MSNNVFKTLFHGSTEGENMERGITMPLIEYWGNVETGLGLIMLTNMVRRYQVLCL